MAAAVNYEAAWRINLRREIDRLGAELRRPPGFDWRRINAGIITRREMQHFGRVREYVSWNQHLADHLRDGTPLFKLAQFGAPTAITNWRTGTTYQWLPQALYSGIIDGDEIILPAGLTNTFSGVTTPYANWSNTNSSQFGYNDSGSDNMVLGNFFGGSASGATTFSIIGAGAANNGRAVISPPYGHLTTQFTPGDTVLHLDSVADFVGLPISGSFAVFAWGDGITTWAGNQFNCTGINSGSNQLTGVSAGPSTVVPSGSTIVLATPKAIFTSASSTSPGIAFTNLEIWGSVSGGSGTGGGIFQWPCLQGQAFGDTIVNNCYIRDCEFALRPGVSSIGLGVYMKIYNSEFYRCGIDNSRTHNAYINCDELIASNLYSHFTTGNHRLKTRARTSFIVDCAIWGEGTDPNADNRDSRGIDASNGGLVYIIGGTNSQSLNGANQEIGFNEEGGDSGCSPGAGNSAQTGERGASNPTQELYYINSTVAGPANGHGAGTGNSGSNVAPITIGSPGVNNPEIPFTTSVAGGSLPARSYWFCTTCLTSGGGETIPSAMTSFDAFTPVTGQISLSANTLATMPSPMTRTGAVTWNNYAAHADPVIYYSGGTAAPPQNGNFFFWDAGLTQPIFSQAAGGTNPAFCCYCGFTYTFPEGESVNFALAGLSATYFASTGATAPNAALFQVNANNLLSVASPPAVTGATGWNFYMIPVTYSSGGAYFGGTSPTTPLSRQNQNGPIAIGTPWTMPTTGFIAASTFQYNFYKQNASPIAMGTGWTEPTSGLTNLNPSLLAWQERMDVIGGGKGWNPNGTNWGFNQWYAQATGNLTNYTVQMPNNNFVGSLQSVLMSAVIVKVSGAQAGWPFDASVGIPPSSNSGIGSSINISTSAAVTLILAAFRNTATAGAGFTQAGAPPNLLVEYKIVSSPQTNLACTQTGGSNPTLPAMMADAIVQASGQTLAVTTYSATVTGGTLTLTVPSISTGDLLYLITTTANGPYVTAIDYPGPPVQSTALSGSPLGLVQNCISFNYNPTGAAGAPAASGGWFSQYPNYTLPIIYPTLGANNLQANTYNGSFQAPLAASVVQSMATNDFRLVPGSPAIGAGANPGSSPEGQSLVPTTQSAIFGAQTPGAVLPVPIGRSDGGLNIGAFAYPYGSPVGPRIRLRMGSLRGWLLAGTAAAVVANPVVGRRGMLGLRR